MSSVIDRSTGERLFKVTFDLEPESPTWPPVLMERIWAAKTRVKLHLVVRNTPFYVKGIAYGDVILVRPDNDRREVVYERLIEESGHSTIRVILREVDMRDDVESILVESGCEWEMMSSPDFYAVDVRPETDYVMLRNTLLHMREEGILGFEEGAIARKHQRQISNRSATPD